MGDIYDVLLVDLGGVVIELGGVPIWQAWTGAENEAEVWERWLRSAAVRRFESGRCGAEEFSREIVEEFGLAVAPADFAEQFARWPRGVYPGVAELLMRARRHLRVACLSNCNELHWPRFMGEMGLREVFEPALSSHQLGALKPDAEIFALAAERLECPPQRILFVDDNQINVDGALSAGYSARLVRGPEALRSLLLELGLS